MTWCYVLAVISYSILVIQFISSLFKETNEEFSFKDLFSFNGFVYFMVGFSGYLITNNSVTVESIVIGIITGIICALILFFVYKRLAELSHEPNKENLVNEKVTVLNSLEDDMYVCRLDNYKEIKCKCYKHPKTGDRLTITAYQNNLYYIN